MRLPCSKLAVSLLLALGSASAFAGSVSVDTDTGTAGIQANNSINLGGTRAVNLVFNRANAGEIVTSVSGNPGLSYDTAAFDVSSSGAACTVTEASGTVAFIDLDFAGLADGRVICTLTFTNTGGAGGDVEPLTLSGVQPVGTTTADGQLTLQSGPAAPVISIADGTANGLGVGTAAVTKVDGNGAPTSSYTCTAPAGFTLTANASQTGIANGGPDPGDIGFTCSPGAVAVTQTMNCTITEGGVPRADTVDLTCPALAPVNPVITSAPANGSTTALSGGLIGSTRQTTINFTATGANSLGTASISCSASGAVTVAPGGAQTVTGTAQPVDQTVSCTLTDTAQAGAVTCAITDAGGTRTDTYNFTCPAGSTFIPAPSPEVVPATSLWSKIGLIGLLAALGMLMVGFRRNH